MSDLTGAIGGYFSLELPQPKEHYHPDLLHFQSARAAFYSLLRTGSPRKVWMPYYICDSMLSPLYEIGVPVSFYSLNSDFSVKDDIELLDGEWIVYVNYFGICGAEQNRLLSKYPKEQLVFDHSQAFFQKPLDCLATIYSPRKFFGVPDGGMLSTQLKIRNDFVQDESSYDRIAHLLKRTCFAPEKGYADYQMAESSLHSCQPKGMSRFTDNLLKTIDYSAVKNQRNSNFWYLHEALASVNKIQIDNVDGPMVYPFLMDNVSLKYQLIQRRIFIPTYWPEVAQRGDSGVFERKLIADLNALPCDQRYSVNEMDNILRLINECIR
ncbi:hypothetical protein G6364_13370 [Vibrio cholerae]|uniref:hypothetical protein n=1 Tax=Vibrio cholerae TaxID=666 RepID=UPI0006E66DCF|nr:hypothetical protein [Vibrio cholerae]KQA38444.1 hypothetical protein XV74_13010 [Vibrio cholerae]KQA48251.1 hypothetical protein XV75_00410 [Vibrio cholerae]KQA56060.1 hypothetical protein XV79_14155 [Vibrio cholerae]KQA77392.1 hypothetical protein XV84_00410 [Vibrio cholerae]KQA79960.1 hypothetical protein XV85_03035 [Vibrio cholerae]